MSDLIYRDDATRLIDEYIIPMGMSERDLEAHEPQVMYALDWLDKKLRGLPPVEIPPGRKPGRWIIMPNGIEGRIFERCKCSECGTVRDFAVGSTWFRYCPTCGAEMRGVG